MQNRSTEADLPSIQEDAAQERPPETTRLSQWRGWFFDMRCPCGGTIYPVQLLAARLGGNPTVGNVLGRLVCKKCRNPPISVVLVDNPVSHQTYGPAVRKVHLIPRPSSP